MSRLTPFPPTRSPSRHLRCAGQGYDDLSGLLRLDADEVRSRATARSTRWAQVRPACRPSAGTISDWLLGQRDPDEAAATRAFVDGSTAGRVGARRRARAEPLAGDRLPGLCPPKPS
jgi:hypothetical protein